jgi:hypothetical protein
MVTSMMVSLHGSMVSLLGPRVNLCNSRVRLNDFSVSLYCSRVSIYSSLLSLHSRRLSFKHCRKSWRNISSPSDISELFHEDITTNISEKMFSVILVDTFKKVTQIFPSSHIP